MAQTPTQFKDVTVKVPSADVVSDLAPTGSLRASINLGNPVRAQGTPNSPTGVTVDIAREVAARLGVPAQFVCFDAARKPFQAICRGQRRHRLPRDRARTQLGLEAAAGIRQPMATFVAQNASLLLIEERFMEIRQALGVSRTRTPEAIRFLSATIEELEASGFVRDALRGPGRSQLRSGRHVAQGWHLLDGGPLGG